MNKFFRKHFAKYCKFDCEKCESNDCVQYHHDLYLSLGMRYQIFMCEKCNHKTNYLGESMESKRRRFTKPNDNPKSS